MKFSHEKSVARLKNGIIIIINNIGVLLEGNENAVIFPLAFSISIPMNYHENVADFETFCYNYLLSFFFLLHMWYTCATQQPCNSVLCRDLNVQLNIAIWKFWLKQLHCCKCDGTVKKVQCTGRMQHAYFTKRVEILFHTLNFEMSLNGLENCIRRSHEAALEYSPIMKFNLSVVFGAILFLVNIFHYYFIHNSIQVTNNYLINVFFQFNLEFLTT